MRAAIVGCGLGGATAAIFLSRAGYDVTVYEQAPALTRIGAGISLGPNVLKVMREIGLADRLIEVGTMARLRLSRAWDTGATLNEIRYSEFRGLYGETMISMHRGDMLQILHDAIEPGRVLFSKRASGIESAPNGTARITFADGTEAEADLVIGADGVNSIVREVLLGPEPPIYTGFVAYRAIIPTHLLGDFRPLADHTKWWTTESFPPAEDRHFITYYLTNERDELYFVTGSPAPEWDPNVSAVPVEISEIKDCYAGFHDEVQRTIDACPAATKWPLLERKPLTLWSRENVVLLGDACHPMKPHMGQGAGMAIEDAAILARSLDAADDLDEALAIYAHSRKDRTARVQDQSRINTWFKYPADMGWVYGYDAIRVPLSIPERPAPA
ncbi:MAG: FAD-dependent monooxygenase [Parvibaculaceae bacterium]